MLLALKKQETDGVAILETRDIGGLKTLRTHGTEHTIPGLGIRSCPSVVRRLTVNAATLCPVLDVTFFPSSSSYDIKAQLTAYSSSLPTQLSKSEQ